MDEKIIESIKSKLAEDEFKAVLDLKQRNVAVLGSDEVFALRDSKGEIRAFKQLVTLSKEAGTLIQPVPHGPWVVSAQGYEILGEAAGVCVIFPQACVVDGQEKSNPYTLRDTENGRVLAVYARAVAFRFSSKGLPQVADWTTMFDLPSYRLIDLLAKAKDAPTAFKLLPIEFPAPDATAGATWAKYKFDSSTSLWINTSHASALDWYKQIINREKKALDFGQTFARRNAVKHLLGIQKSPCSPKDESPYWDVTILCWRPTSGNPVKWDYTRYNDVRRQIEANATGAFCQDVDLKKGVEDGAEAVSTGESASVDLEDAIDITPGAAAPEKPIEDLAETVEETKPEEKPVDPPPAGPAKETKKETTGPTLPAKKVDSKEAAGVFKNIEMAKAAFPEEYSLCLIQCGVDEPLELEEARQVLVAINRALDKNL